MSQDTFTRLTDKELLDQQQKTARKYSRSIERLSGLQRAAMAMDDSEAVDDYQTALNELRKKFTSTLISIKSLTAEVPA